MKVESVDLLRAVKACSAAIPRFPTRPEYGRIRIRVGWTSQPCVEVFNGNDMIRVITDIQYEDGERLDCVVEPKPLIAWLDYADEEISIEMRNGKLLLVGATSTELPPDTAFFPTREAPEDAEWFVLEKDDWGYLSGFTGTDPIGDVDVGALHLFSGDPPHAMTTESHKFAIVKLRGTVTEDRIVPGNQIDIAFRAVSSIHPDTESIRVQLLDSGYYVESDMVQVWLADSATQTVIRGHYKQIVSMPPAFMKVDTSEIKPALKAVLGSALTKKQQETMRAKFFTFDGFLFITESSQDFRINSKPLCKANVEIPLEFSQTMVNAQYLYDIVSNVSGPLEFMKDPREGPTEFIVRDESRIGFVLPMQEKKRN